LPGLPGSAAFTSVAAVVAIYLGSSDFTNLSPATQRDRRRILEWFRETYGEQDFAALTGAHVDKILATFGHATSRSLLK